MMTREIAQKTIEAAILWTHVDPDRLHEAYSVMAGTQDLQLEIANLRARLDITKAANERQDKLIEELVTALEELAARVGQLEEHTSNLLYRSPMYE